MAINYYKPLVSEGYEWVNCIDDTDYEIFWAFNGSLHFERWQPVMVRRVRADDQQDFTPSDFPWLGAHALVMRLSVINALDDILEANGEVLPLSTEDDVKLFVFNAQVVDALDEEQANIMRIPGTNRIMRIVEAAFIESALRGIDIFRLPHRASSTYVSQSFVNRVKESGLVGLEFEKVWSPS